MLYDKKFLVSAAKSGTAVFVFILIVEGIFKMLKTIFVGAYALIVKLIRRYRNTPTYMYPIVSENNCTNYLPKEDSIPTGLKLGVMLQHEHLQKQGD
jgi:nitrate reductase NapE component